MGKQIIFYMLPDDAHSFFEFVQENGLVKVVYRSSDSLAIEAVGDPSHETQTMTLWNPMLLPSLERKKVSHPGREYFGIDGLLPTIEFLPSQLCEWNGMPALRKGRIYGAFDRPVKGYDRWYNTVARWIRKNFVKSPVKALGGYVGPNALKWYEQGGVLLPMFNPPNTLEWRALIENEHGASVKDASKLV